MREMEGIVPLITCCHQIALAQTSDIIAMRLALLNQGMTHSIDK